MTTTDTMEKTMGARDIRALVVPIYEGDRDVSRTDRELSDAIVDTADKMEEEAFSIPFVHYLWVDGLIYRALRTQDKEDAERALNALADIRNEVRFFIVKMVPIEDPD